jgi:hypothetical protein
LNAARVDFLLGNMACPEAQQKAADDGDDQKDEGGKHEGLRGVRTTLRSADGLFVQRKHRSTLNEYAAESGQGMARDKYRFKELR